MKYSTSHTSCEPSSVATSLRRITTSTMIPRLQSLASYNIAQKVGQGRPQICDPYITSRSDKYIEIYTRDAICITSCTVFVVRHCCAILTSAENSRRILIKLPIIKFNENPFIYCKFRRNVQVGGFASWWAYFGDLSFRTYQKMFSSSNFILISTKWSHFPSVVVKMFLMLM
jgi:hypothetical protein